MLQQRLSQKILQKLSPQQIQLMKLLQIPTSTLDQRIQEEIEANPALEEGANESTNEELNGTEDYEADAPESADTEIELDDYIQEYIEDDPMSYNLKTNNYNLEDENKAIPISVESTFHDYLEHQLGLLDLKDARKIQIARQIIGSIDDDGYLRRTPAAIMDDLVFSQNITAEKEEIEALLDKIKEFDPPGVGASNLQECLVKQMQAKIEGLDHEDDTRLLALDLLANHFDAFSKKHYTKLTRQLDITDEQLKEAIDEIVKLNPKPASGFLKSNSRSSLYIVPDFTIVNRDGELELLLNSKNAPDLKINGQYVNLLQIFNDKNKGKRSSKKEQETIMFVKQKINSAKWFIDAIKQRQQTLFTTMYAIMQYQKAYFTTGDDRRLKPMILKDIAEITGLDISTISRVANSKFVQTEFGTKRLKDFFSESVIKEDGEEVSTLEVKKILMDVIVKEDKSKPLSDEKLKVALKKHGYNIARRTIAKYREQLNIPVARLRKEL